MIRIFRDQSPAILADASAKACAELCEKVEQDGDRYPLRFHDHILRNSDLREELSRIHRRKCCYCERRIESGAVDHYRPKRCYYWLAYTWENLLYACSDCNRHKHDHFPLADETRRVSDHRDAHKVAAEEPLLLDPSSTDPAEHIEFRDHTPIARTPRGRATIDLLRLDRESLEEQRRDLRRLVTALLVILTHGNQESREAAEALVQLSDEGHAHAAMIRATLRARLGPELGFPLDPKFLLRWASPQS